MHPCKISTNPIIRPRCRSIAVSPDVVILIVRISSAAQVEPAVSVAGVIGNEFHDQLQTWWKQREIAAALKTKQDT